MERKNKTRDPDRRAAKKAVVMGTGEKNRKPMAIVLAIVGLLVGGAFWVTMDKGVRTEPVAGAAPAARTATAVAHPVSLFADGKARHFEYVYGGFTIRYFVVKSSDGVIRAAYDACDVCWPAGKGYYQDGDDMVCRNCGRRFASVLLNEVQGGCNPAPLTRHVDNGQVVIRIEDILAGKRYFDFKGGQAS
jgi:uncharacterized membrane protein